MTVNLLEKNKTLFSSIEDTISSLLASADYKKLPTYLSICDFLGVQEIGKEEAKLFFLSKPLNIDLFLQTLSEPRLKSLVRGIIAGDNNFKYLPADWQEKFINELSSNRDLIVWIKKKINDLKEEPKALKLIMGGYFFEGESDNIIKKSSLSELLSGKNDEEVTAIRNFINQTIIGALEEKPQASKDYGITNGIDAKLAAINLGVEIEDIESLTSHDANKRNQAIGAVVKEFADRLNNIEARCKASGIDHLRMLEDLVAPATAPTLDDIKKAVEKANFTTAIKVIKFFEEALYKVEILATYVPGK